MASSKGEGTWGLTDSGTVWGLAIVVLAVIGILAVLRHLFGSVRPS